MIPIIIVSEFIINGDVLFYKNSYGYDIQVGNTVIYKGETYIVTKKVFNNDTGRFEFYLRKESVYL